VTSRRAAVRRFGHALTLALVLVVGCSEAPTGATKKEFEDQRAALKARVAKQAEHKKPKLEQASVKGKEAAPSESGMQYGSADRDYVYDPTGKRDPFRSFKWEKPDRISDEPETPLESFDLSQLSLVAVVWKTGSARALVQDPSGETYIISEGSRIGKNEGRVLSISDNVVLVKETYFDALGQRTTKDIEMRMRGNEGG
jgi:Tfp pilus assembly protein PilP